MRKRRHYLRPSNVKLRAAFCDQYARDRGSAETGLSCMSRAARLRETDCVAGHIGLELGNVVANYPFEKSRRFTEIQPNFGHETIRV
jgi:hypothetical protein